MTDPRFVPVIVGVGETIDRDSTQEPRALLLESVRKAVAEAPDLLAEIDSIDVVSMMSWRYADIAGVLAGDLGIEAARAVESMPGGEKPIRLLGEAAQRISSGATRAALICGAEAARTRSRAAQAGQTLAWGPTDTNAKSFTALDFVTQHAARYGLTHPSHVYPLYENATRHSWQQSAEDSELESAVLWSRYSEAASRNPTAWLPKPYAADRIRENSADNRMISYPYRKLMVANPLVNQGAAILLTSLAAAREAGVPDERIVYIWSGARANEPADFLGRDCYDRSTAQDAVLGTALSMSELAAREIDLFELYSCFPTVPKMARRALGLGDDIHPSVTGGLTFFGGPANNFMTHAIAAAVRAIRTRTGRTALLYGQGEFVTKHAAIVLADHAGGKPTELRDVQDVADAAAGPAPALLEDYEGAATIESFTIVYDRDGQPVYAPIVARTANGDRVVAQGAGQDRVLMEFLSDRQGDPIGSTGRITRADDGLLRFIR